MIHETNYIGRIGMPSTNWHRTRRSGRLDLGCLAEPELRSARSTPPAASVLLPIMDTDEQDAERWDGLA